MFSENLRKRRLELGMSQGELAEKAGYRSRSSITKLESGTSDIPQKKLRLLAEALNTTPEELIGGERLSFLRTESKAKGGSERESRVIVLIQAGGKSTRNMLSIPSQFVNVDEKPIIAYTMEAYERHPLVDEINIVCVYGWEKTLQSYAEKYHISKLNSIITGGRTIIDSVKLGMNHLKKTVRDNDVIILQEATRPMISTGLISKIISSYNEFGASVFVKPMTEYVQIEIEKGNAKMCNRNLLFSIESPEIYSVGTLQNALDRQKKEAPDDGSCCAVMMDRLGMPLHYCESNAVNLKIVRQEDVYYFKVLKQVLL